MNIGFVSLVSLAVIAGAARQAGAQQCLHGTSETPDQRNRREQALKVAHQINLAQMTLAKTPGSSATPRFRPLNELPNISPAPAGFAVTLATDGATYAFSIKDTRDPCHFAIFSDQDRWIYEATPTTSAVILPATR